MSKPRSLVEVAHLIMSRPRSLLEQLDAKSLIPYKYEAVIPLFIFVLWWFVDDLVMGCYVGSAIFLLLGVYIIFAVSQPMGSFHYWMAVTLRLIVCVIGIMLAYDWLNKNGRLSGWDIAIVWLLTYPIGLIMELAIISGVSHPALVWIWSTRHIVNIGMYGKCTLDCWTMSNRVEMVVFLFPTIFEIVQLSVRLEKKEFTSLYLALIFIAILYFFGDENNMKDFMNREKLFTLVQDSAEKKLFELLSSIIFLPIVYEFYRFINPRE